jgi:hypothetical protein
VAPSSLQYSRSCRQRWVFTLEPKAAIFETNTDNLCQRIEDAQDAIMDHIEDSFQTASQSERQSLINAMNSLRELRRVVRTPESEIAESGRDLSDA